MPPRAPPSFIGDYAFIYSFSTDCVAHFFTKCATIYQYIPTKVCRSALENAASVASMVLTTESLVTDIPTPPAPAAPAPDMGGMY